MTGRGDWLLDPGWRRATRCSRSMSCRSTSRSTLIRWPMPRRWPPAIPGIQMMLNHTGLPVRRDPEYMVAWRRGMRTLAARPERRREDLWPRHVRAGLDGGQHPPARARHDRDLRGRALPVRVQLPGRPAGWRLRSRSGTRSIGSPPASPTTSAARCSTTTLYVYIACERKGGGRKALAQHPTSGADIARLLNP